jgi:hypothetical protein
MRIGRAGELVLGRGGVTHVGQVNMDQRPKGPIMVRDAFVTPATAGIVSCEIKGMDDAPLDRDEIRPVPVERCFGPLILYQFA